MDPIVQYIIVGIYGGVIVWLCIKGITHGEKIVTMDTKMDFIIKSQKDLDDKLNLFIKQEIDILKNLVPGNARKPR
jgi:hypothetical protein